MVAVPKYRLNYLYAWMAYSLGRMKLAYSLISDRYHYNHESRNLKLAILADSGRVDEAVQFFQYCLDGESQDFQRTRLGQRGKNILLLSA